MRQEPTDIPALAVPYGQDSLDTARGPSVFSTGILQMGSCGASFGLAWQRNLMSDNHTSFREHFSHNEIRSQNRGSWAQTPARKHMFTTRSLDRNDLGGRFKVARTSRPRDPVALVRIRLGLCFRVSYLLSRSVRIPGSREND